MDYRHVLQRDTVLDGKYRIERVIGAGGFGITYEALDLGLATRVAVKEYYPAQLAMRDTTLTVRPSSDQDKPLFERLRASFLREARTLARFEHPAIVGVLNVFEWHGTAYMVMKLEGGPSLKAWLAALGRPPTQAELDAIAGPLLDALAVMHAADFLHRDIAPDNIIIRDDGSPVLLDFGASRRVMGAGDVALTGVVKKGYSPQEQYAGEARSQGPWTDIYAMAATLYLAIAGKPPLDATERMLEDDLPAAATVAPEGLYRPAFLEAIGQGMRLRPKERPQSIGDWRQTMFAGRDAAPLSRASDAARGVTGARDTQIGVVATDLLQPSAPVDRVSRPTLAAASRDVQAGPVAQAARRRRPLQVAVLALAGVALLGGMLAFGFGGLGGRTASVGSSTTVRDVVPSTRDDGARLEAAARLAREAAAARAREDAERATREAQAARARDEAQRSADRQRTANAAGNDAVPSPSPAAQTALVGQIRRELNRVGCRTEATAPGWVDADQKALTRFVRYAGGNISFTALNAEIAEAVGSYVGRVCPLACGPGETPETAQCVAARAPATAEVPLCSQINERAQLGTLTEDDRERLRAGRCR